MRFAAGGLRAQPVDLPLQPLLDGLAAEARVLAADRGLSLRVVPTSAWVHSDPQLLRRVLQNFLSNAVRYTRSGGIVLGVRRRGKTIIVQVADSGIGIDPSQQRAVFEEFRRLARGGQGLGLGLAIADRLSRLLGTRVLLRSRVGHGSVFGIALPRVAAKPALAAALPLREDDAAPLSLRVLVVDNEPTVLAATQTLLEGWGAEVCTAAGPADAVREAEAFEPQAWLLDFHLDDGETGDALHAPLAARWPTALGIIVSADHSEAVRRVVGACGALALSKPLKPLKLRTLLRGASAAGLQHQKL